MIRRGTMVALTLLVAGCGDGADRQPGAAATLPVPPAPVVTPSAPPAPVATASTPAPVATAPTPAPAPSARLRRLTLRVAGDGCGVIRSEVPGPPPGHPVDSHRRRGFDVLGRNAAYETRYRYFQPGRYGVVVKAFDGTGYVAISNQVSIVC